MNPEIESQVRAQYERYPYPAREPAEDARLITDVRSPLASFPHLRDLGFGGRLPDRPLRILVAGGGTGDATLQLAWQLRRHEPGGEIVHVDLSEAAIAIAAHRIERMGLRHVTMRQGSLVDLDPADIGHFDIINCSGVLHHLPDPWAGVRALRGVLAEDGVMGIMVYGRYGRHGLYAAQELLQRVAGSYPTPEQVKIAQHVLARLPEHHPLTTNRRVGYAANLPVEELVDRFLHPCDRAFSVPEVVEWMGDTDMRVIDFVPALRYATVHLDDPVVASRLSEGSRFDRYALAELASFQMDRHTFLAVRDDNPVTPTALGPDVVASLRGGPGFARQLQAEGAFGFAIDGQPLQIPLSPTPLRVAVLESLDGRRPLGALAAGFEVDWATFAAELADVFAPLRDSGLLTLRLAS